jgi:hypothetical protein
MENKKLKKHSTPSSFEDKQIFLSEIHWITDVPGLYYRPVINGFERKKINFAYI